MGNDEEILDTQCYHPYLNLNVPSPGNFDSDNVESAITGDRELEEIIRVDELCDEGIELIHMVYTFRSVSKSIPENVSQHRSALIK